ARQRSLASLLAGIAAVAPRDDVAIGGITLDSRKVKQGDLFIAAGGTRVHGALFIEQAVRNGAAAVVAEPSGEVALPAGPLVIEGRSVPLIVAEGLRQQIGAIAARFHGDLTQQMFVAGVTGTNGKTSVSHFIAQVLNGRGPCGLVGTLGSGLYGELGDIAGRTTPDAVTLHENIAHMYAAGARQMAMEVSSHGLDQGRVAGVAFDVAVFTNLTHEHLDYHGDMASYADAKRRLFDLPGIRLGVINADDAVGRRWLADLAGRMELISYGLENGEGVGSGLQPTLYGHALKLHGHGLSMSVASPWGEARLDTGLIGRFNASNLLAALGALIGAGLSFAEAINGLSRVSTVPGRMERFGGTDGDPLVVVDYAHTPDALEQVLKAAGDHCTGHLWCVFGCGGNRDSAKRPIMGRVAEMYADCIIITDDNPRDEDPYSIIEAILSGMTDADRPYVIRDREAAIARAIALCHSGDVVVVAGKGHETEQEIAGKKYPFSDREVVARIVAAGAHHG
ncbi:MAG TPA: UDP-N-acetylmuramoyl-L-alanyl-D-glutamate--2,6-diaminopimelate ligase, partial [Gammaproteobacteria bacterium]